MILNVFGQMLLHISYRSAIAISLHQPCTRRDDKLTLYFFVSPISHPCTWKPKRIAKMTDIRWKERIFAQAVVKMDFAFANINICQRTRVKNTKTKAIVSERKWVGNRSSTIWVIFPCKLFSSEGSAKKISIDKKEMMKERCRHLFC